MRMRYWYHALILSFLLGSRNGFIALWKIPAREPVYVFPYSVASLPPADREKLEQGIILETPEELAAILEDYLS